ncbi:MAG: hypothetical protein Q8P67_23025 [archaeon]|nr:hypothetical protein [archaeon]
MDVAFLIEGLVNLISGGSSLIKPELMMDGILQPGLSLDQKEMAIEMSRWFGAMVLAQAVLLYHGLWDGPAALSVRRTVYWSLLAGECFFAPVYYCFINRFGIWALSSVATIGILLLLVPFRLYALYLGSLKVASVVLSKVNKRMD